MAIAKNPKRIHTEQHDRKAEDFISGAGQPAEPALHDASSPNRKPVIVRVDPEMLKRIDRAAKRLGLSRSAFMVSSAAERLERME